MADRHRILVVCEDATMLDRISNYLVEQGFDVRCASQAPQAVECARNWVPALVICDFKLGQMASMELADTIREIHPRTRFILITPPGETPEFARAAASRIIAYLGKPFNPEDLMHFVYSAFNTTDNQSNRREHSRHSFIVEAHLTLINPFDDSESRPIASLMRDVSRSGVTMIVRQVLPVPAMLKINFHMNGQQGVITMLAKSLSCTLTQIPGVFRLGAKFIGLLPCELEKTFVKMNRECLGADDKDIYMGKSFKEAALEWLANHREDFASNQLEFSQRLIAEMAHEFFRNPGDEDLPPLN